MTAEICRVLSKTVLAAAAAFLLTACSSGKEAGYKESQLPGSDANPALTAGTPLAEFPAPSELARGAADAPTEDERHRGGQFFEEPPKASRVSLATYSPDWHAGDPVSKAAWAMYRFFNLQDYAGSQVISTFWQEGPPQEGRLFYGFSDFARDRWIWYAADEDARVSIPSFDPYVDSSDRTLVMVVLIGDQQRSLDWILLGDSLAPSIAVNVNLDPDPLQNIGPLPLQIDCTDSYCVGAEIVSYDFDWEGDGVYDVQDDSDGFITHDFAPGSYDLTVRVTTSESVQATAVRNFVIINPANQQPTASFTASFSSGNAPLAVDFNPALSSDPDGEIVSYEWDFNNDGQYELMTASPDIQSLVFGMHGLETVKLRVTDADLAQDEESINISINNGWKKYDVDSSVQLLGKPVICPLGLAPDALPGIAYRNVQGDELVFKSGTANAQTWSERRLLADTLANKGYGLSLAYSISQSRIMLAFGRYENISVFDYRQYFISSTDSSGEAWGAPVLVDGNLDVGRDSSLCIVGNIPCIAAAVGHDTPGASRLVYYQANEGLGQSWQAPVEILGSSANRLVGSVALGLQGTGLLKRPLAACGIEDVGIKTELAISLATGIDGNGWNAPSLPAELLIGSIDMETVNDVPALAVGGLDTAGTLNYTRAAAGDGSSWPGPVTEIGSGRSASLAVVDGRPGVAFISTPDNHLCFVHAADANGSAWAEPMIIDNDGRHESCAMAVINGEPLIVYYQFPGNLLASAIWG